MNSRLWRRKQIYKYRKRAVLNGKKTGEKNTFLPEMILDCKCWNNKNSQFRNELPRAKKKLSNSTSRSPSHLFDSVHHFRFIAFFSMLFMRGLIFIWTNCVEQKNNIELPEMHTWRADKTKTAKKCSAKFPIFGRKKLFLLLGPFEI